MAAASGCENDAVAHPEENLTESLRAFSNLASATAADHGVVTTLSESNESLAKLPG